MHHGSGVGPLPHFRCQLVALLATMRFVINQVPNLSVMVAHLSPSNIASFSIKAHDHLTQIIHVLFFYEYYVPKL